MAWPLPALGAWALAWALYLLLSTTSAAPGWVAAALATALGVVLSLFGTTPWRRVFVAAGFPLSLLASGAAALPAWAWLLPLVALVAIYPLDAWSDAPLFPTPTGALRGLASLVPLAPQAHVLDAGCGLGAGLIELRSEYPQARLAGLEWSWPLRLLCALRCRDAMVRRGDIWAADWSAHDLVYLFQRPESMARAVEKAARELRPGAWLASLEFEASMLKPAARLQREGAKPVWLYRAPFVPR